MKRSILPALPLLALAACSGGGEDSDAPETEIPGDVSDAEGDGAPAHGDLAYPSASATTIPAEFQGVWDYIEGTCDRASDLRMEIGPDMIVYYESVGEVLAAQPRGDDAVAVEMAMSGEGETWSNTTVLMLTEGGAILETDDRSPTGGGNLQRKRCSE